MKKVITILGCALFVAAMTVACGSKNTENTEAVETPAEEIVDEAAAVEAPAATEADNSAMLAAAAEAGQAICDCANGDAASIEKCMKSVLAASYSAYEGNEEFTAAVKNAIGKCAQDKAKAAAKKAVDKEVNKAANKAAEALAGKLGK